MLKAEPETSYIVFPSWVDNHFTFRWEDLPRLFADPLKSGYLDENDWRYVRSGMIPVVAPPVELLDGPCGGGIIAASRPEKGNWLPDCILDKEAEYHRPPGFGPWVDRVADKLRVSVLEMRGDAGQRFWGLGVKKPQQYICTASIEHASAAGDNVYWFVDYRSGKSELKGLESIVGWAAGWGLNVHRLEGMPPELREETESWFAATDRSRCWFQVIGGGAGAGLEFAKMLYIGLHLRWIGGGRMKSMHLVADVEWRPNFRKDLQYK